MDEISNYLNSYNRFRSLAVTRKHGSFEKQDSGEDYIDTGAKPIVDMTAFVDEKAVREFELPSNDPFLPELHQIGNELDDITNSIAVQDGVSFYPKNITRNPSPVIKRLCTRIEEKCGKDEKSLAYLANSLSVTLNIPCKDRVPSQVISDACLLSDHAPVYVLTVVQDGADSANIRDYNLDITKGLVSEVRNFTDEHFSALYGVLQEKDLESVGSFEVAVDSIESSSSSFCIPDSLSMTEAKFKNVLKALTASVAVSRAVKVVKASTDVEDAANFQDEEEEEDLWFLTKEQFHLLTENIDTSGLVVVWAAPHTGSTTLMVEVASRLEKSGRTMLVSGSETVCQSARNHRVCSRVVGREEFLKLQTEIGDMLADVDHVVAEDIPESLLQQGSQQSHVWLCMKIKDKTLPNEKAASGKTPVLRPANGAGVMLKYRVSIPNCRPVRKDTISFKIAADFNDPWVYDFTVVTVSGMNVIVAIDPHNNRVKSFYTVNGEQNTHFICIDKETKGITNLNNMAAITVPGCRLIRILCVTPDLIPHSVINTERRYHSIAGFGPENIAACAPKDGPPCVDIIDYSGKILKSITKDGDGNDLFQYPLTLHATFPTILVYDKYNGSVVCVNEQGQVGFKYCPEKKLENPCGMTITPGGDILVAESRLHRIILLSTGGKFVKEILTRKDKVIFPYRLCCDRAGLLYAALHYKEVGIYEFK